MQYGIKEKKMPSKYRKKPVVVEARQWLEADEAYELAEWAGGDYMDDLAGASSKHSEGEDWGLFEVYTLEGSMTVSPGDFIIRGVQGEFYPCKPDIFEATYEEAD